MSASAFTKPAHQPNEDNFIADSNLKLFGVFDGMGGYEGGAAAAQIAANTVLKIVKNSKMEAKKLLEKALVTAAKKIVEDGQIHNRPYQGTTATVVLITKMRIIIANVGDSRCYGLTQNEKLTRLTVDHGILEELVRTGRISPRTAKKIDQAKNLDDLSYDEQMIFNQRHIVTAALSAEFKESDIYFNQVDLENFKTLILTADGIHDNLTDEEIKTIILESKNLQDSAKNLVEEAYKVSIQNTFRSKPDDITVVVVNL